MQVKDIMVKHPACCTPNTPLQEIAQEMVKHDCGCIPIVENDLHPKLVGVVTDRDIVCRIIAKGKNPQFLNASECMTTQVVTVTPETDLDTCCHMMEEHQVRRIPVVDKLGNCYGIVAQADIAQACEPATTAEVVKDISRHTEGASHMALV